MNHINSPKRHERVLVISTHEEIVKKIRDVLHYEGFVVFESVDTGKILQSIKEEAPDVIIWDVSQIGNCDEFMKQLRQKYDTPILILNPKGNSYDKLRYLKLGADDCIIKPFNNEELIARIKSLSRLTWANRLPREPSIRVGRIKIDFAARHVRVAGHESKLSRKEYDLLYELVLNAGKVLTYDYILQQVWGFQGEKEREYVHSYIKFLRSKIEPDPHNPRFIISLPSIGYMFRNTYQKSL